jgi:undecaprenyl-diphosphatase
MHNLLNIARGFDVSVYYWLSQFHGNWHWDRLVSHVESNVLFKSGVLVSLYWYFWARNDDQQRERRTTIVAILVGAVMSVLVARTLAGVLPFRLRPISDPSLNHRPLAFALTAELVNWSSFPSDHAAFLAAMGFGLVRIYRRLAIPVVLFLACWVCLPRLYLGIHFASDLLVGLGIGVGAVWACLRVEGLGAHLARPVLAFEQKKPQFFYAAAFLLMFELANMFDDVRDPVRSLWHAFTAGPHHQEIADIVLMLVAIGMIVFALRPNPRRSAPAQPGSSLPKPPTSDQPGVNRQRPSIVGGR